MGHRDLMADSDRRGRLLRAVWLLDRQDLRA